MNTVLEGGQVDKHMDLPGQSESTGRQQLQRSLQKIDQTMASMGDLLSRICDNLFSRSTSAHGDDSGPPGRKRARTHSLSASKDSADDDSRPLGDTQPEADALSVHASDETTSG